jgi:hypothetical protein
MSAAIAGSEVAITVESVFSMNKAVATMSGTRRFRGMISGLRTRHGGMGGGQPASIPQRGAAKLVVSPDDSGALANLCHPVISMLRTRANSGAGRFDPRGPIRRLIGSWPWPSSRIR